MPRSRKPRLEKITLSLLKEDRSRNEALRDQDALRGYRVPAIDGERDALFVASRPPKAPPWRTFLASHVEGTLDGVLTASASAVLLLETDGRVFAATFGHGRHLLDPDAFESDFGLKVVLNTVAPDQLKSVDAKTIDDRTMHTRRDLSRSSALSAFGLDVSRDVLRAVTGTPADTSLAHQLTGSDALAIRSRTQVPDLSALAERLLTAYGEDTYKENFEFIDHLRPERDRNQIARLQERLVTDLQDGTITDVHVAAPETVDWLDVDGFRFSSQRRDDEPSNDPSIRTYLQSRDDENIDVALLKRDRLMAISAADGDPIRNWPVYRSLVYQLELDGCLYVLSTGDWFRVDHDYRARVEAEVAALPRLDQLPSPDAGTSEADYNAKAAAAIGGLCLDGRLIQDAGPDKMEFCDILTPNGGLIHVKHRGSSATLSHLYAQGLNSAQRLLVDDAFRASARALIAAADGEYEDLIPNSRPDQAEHEVSFVVITRSRRDTPLTLPFFSVVSLRNATSQLRGLGFPVSVAAVREE